MSSPDTTEIVAEVAEEIADQATHVAEVSRGLSGRSFGLALGGLIVGAGLGGAIGYFFAHRRLEEKYSKQAADEISEMRDHYHAKDVARENTEDKPSVAEIVRDRGYASEEPSAPPMVVSPPAGVVEAAAEADEDKPAPGEQPEPEEPRVQNAFQEFGDDTGSPEEWDYHKERSRRSPLKPYVIHIDEREEHDSYEGVTYTYYEDDDVLANERDEPLDQDDREKLVGEANLERFGHGSDDPTVVYIRNDQLEMDIEVCKSPNSFAEEVHGFEPEIRHSDRRRGRGRPAFDDE